MIGYHRQRGVATLAISVILLLSLTVMALTMTQSGVFQQKISGNDYRAKEVHNAAEAGMQYLVGWVGTHQSSLVTTGTNCITPPSAGLVSGTGTYALTDISGNSRLCYTVAMLGSSGTAQIIKLTATARASNDSNITATITQHVTNTPGVTSTITLTAPPLVLNGCLGKITGNPDITSSNIGIMSNRPAGTLYDGDPCLDPGHFKADCTSADNCPNFYQYGGQFSSVWDYYFRDQYGNVIDPKVLQSLSAAEATAVSKGTMTEDYSGTSALPQRTVYYVTSSSNWHQSVGSATHPVILIFAPGTGCSKINGGPTIYGIVYIADGCPGNDAAGWGATQIYGSLGVEGNLDKFSANAKLNLVTPTSTTIIHTGLSGVYAPLPGTWKDW